VSRFRSVPNLRRFNGTYAEDEDTLDNGGCRYDPTEMGADKGFLQKQLLNKKLRQKPLPKEKDQPRK
jgi:hypothetical protein